MLSEEESREEGTVPADVDDGGALKNRLENLQSLGFKSFQPEGAVMKENGFAFDQMQSPQIDANVLNDIEIEAQYLASSLDNLLENLFNLLNSISSITADNIKLHKNSVNKLSDRMDANIKCMYTIMAKTEETSQFMKSTESLGFRIREIKNLVDMLDH